MTSFYDFITQKSPTGFLLKNSFDNWTKIYLEYIHPYLEKLFKDFNEDSLQEFGLNLYDFLETHKNKNIKFVNRALKFGQANNLKNDEIGLSFICINEKLIAEFEELAKSAEIVSEEYFKKIIDEKGLSDYEILIMGEIFDEINNKNILSRKSNNNLNINFNNKNEKDEEENNSPTPISEDKEIKNTNQPKVEGQNEDFSDDPKYNTLLSLIAKQNNIIINLRKEMISLNENINSLKEKFNDDIQNLNQKINKLNNIHKEIYVREVSKFYINEFSEKNIIKGNNTFQRCENILNYDFLKHGVKSQKNIIIKIVAHYLNANEFSNVSCFINQSNSLNKKNLIEEIQNAYSKFMKFKIDEKNLLQEKYNFFKSSFI